MSKALILLAAAAMMFLSLWLLDYKWGAEALDYQECGGRYCAELDPPSRSIYKR
tara:strand:- start:34 stop:195 length:162 start_codon:yes stop_codon:yes gene_type:complete